MLTAEARKKLPPAQGGCPPPKLAENLWQRFSLCPSAPSQIPNSPCAPAEGRQNRNGQNLPAAVPAPQHLARLSGCGFLLYQRDRSTTWQRTGKEKTLSRETLPASAAERSRGAEGEQPRQPLGNGTGGSPRRAALRPGRPARSPGGDTHQQRRGHPPAAAGSSPGGPLLPPAPPSSPLRLAPPPAAAPGALPRGPSARPGSATAAGRGRGGGGGRAGPRRYSRLRRSDGPGRGMLRGAAIPAPVPPAPRRGDGAGRGRAGAWLLLGSRRDGDGAGAAPRLRLPPSPGITPPRSRAGAAHGSARRSPRS